VQLALAFSAVQPQQPDQRSTGVDAGDTIRISLWLAESETTRVDVRDTVGIIAATHIAGFTKSESTSLDVGNAIRVWVRVGLAKGESTGLNVRYASGIISGIITSDGSSSGKAEHGSESNESKSELHNGKSWKEKRD